MAIQRRVESGNEESRNAATALVLMLVAILALLLLLYYIWFHRPYEEEITLRIGDMVVTGTLTEEE